MAKRICSVEGCGRLYNARGLCLMHYTRFRSTGDPEKTKPSGRRPQSVARRLWSKSQIGADGCIEWTGYVMGNGYGSIYVHERRRKELVHRVAWELGRGVIADGSHIHHLCGNRRCLNTDHMTLVALGEHSAIHAGEQDRSPDGRFAGKMSVPHE